MPTLASVFAIEPFRIGGQEAFGRELSTQLARHGWESVLCFLKEPPPEVRRYLTLPNVHIESVARMEEFHYHPSRGLARLLRKYRPEVLHLHYTSFISPYPWLAKLCGVKRIFFSDHLSRRPFHVARKTALWKRLAARMINLPLTRVVCTSQFDLHCMTALGILPLNRFEMVYNSVDLERVSKPPADLGAFRHKYGIPEGRTLVLQVSWIIPEKGIQLLLEAARLVCARDPNIHFVIAGEGSYRPQYTKRAVEMGLQDRITWTGLLEDPISEGIYFASDIVCQVSYWEELFGWVIAEAMACSRPLVGTRVGGIPELIEEGVTGFVVPRGDATQIAGKILQLAADPALRKRMGQAGKVAAFAKFDLKKNISRLMGLYGIP